MRRTSATRIGAFVLGGLALLVATVIVVSGGALFARTEAAVLHFGGSVYGLQPGAPVVLRGVRVGSVSRIGLEGAAGGGYRIPVHVSLDRQALAAGSDRPGPLLPALVQRGLRGQLVTQSLLTGLLYVDLDFQPGALPAAAQAQPPAAAGGAVEIPTVDAPVQALLAQLQTLDLPRLLDDVQAIAGGARRLMDSPELQRSVQDLAALAQDLRQLTARLDRRIDPLADATQRTLADTRGAMQALNRAATQLDATGARLAAQAEALGAAASPALKSTQAAADELARTAAALRATTADDSALMLNLARSAEDVGRAARALRELAELLERQPSAVIRGRGDTP